MLTAPEHALVQLSGTACKHTPLLVGHVFLAENAPSHSHAVVCLPMPRGWPSSGAIFRLELEKRRHASMGKLISCTLLSSYLDKSNHQGYLLTTCQRCPVHAMIVATLLAPTLVMKHKVRCAAHSQR
jgi:hypothetical protein